MPDRPHSSHLGARRRTGLGGWTHDVAASQHRTDQRRPLRRPRRGRRHQRCGHRRVPGRPGRVGRPHRPRRLRRVHQPGVEQPGLGRVQVPRALRAAAGLRPLPFPQPADEGLPRQHQGDLLPRDARPHRALPAVVRGARCDGVLGHRAVRHQAAAGLRRRAPGRGRAGHRHQHRARRGAVPGLLPRRQRLALRLLLRPLGDRGRRRRRELRRAGVGASGSATAGSAGCATPTPARSSRPRPASWSTPSARSSTSSTPPGGCRPTTGSSTPRASTSSCRG